MRGGLLGRGEVRTWPDEMDARGVAEQLQEGEADGWCYVVSPMGVAWCIEVRDSEGELVDFWRQ